jgi:hypothetical protein
VVDRDVSGIMEELRTIAEAMILHLLSGKKAPRKIKLVGFATYFDENQWFMSTGAVS